MTVSELLTGARARRVPPRHGDAAHRRDARRAGPLRNRPVACRAPRPARG